MDFIKQIFNFSMISGVLLGIIFIIITQFSPRGRDKSVIYLNLVVLFLTLHNLQIFLLDNFFHNANFFCRYLLIPYYVLILPSFYAFITYYLKVEKKLKSYEIFTLLLFCSEIITRIVLAFLFFHDKDNFIIAKYSQIEEIVNATYTLFLFGKSLVLLFRYAKMYQFVLSFDNIQWLKTFMYLGSIVLIMWVSAIILNLDKTLHPEIFIYYPMRLTSSMLLYWIGFQGFYNYSLLFERINLRNAIEVDSNLNPKPSKISETKETNEDKFLIIKNHILNQKRYLDSNLTLEDLSTELKMSVSALSLSINKNSNSNFSDFINNLRVEKAKKLINNPDYNHYTIVSIGLECGFNSKSAFYAAFKKVTQITPSEYKANNT